jgi:glycyl-tRNA synthetase alpha chain
VFLQERFPSQRLTPGAPFRYNLGLTCWSRTALWLSVTTSYPVGLSQEPKAKSQERNLTSSSNPLTFQELILRLQTFWAERGCILQQPYDVEVGAGTMAPETFLRVLGPKPYKVAYVQPSRRPADGRYGENPNRLFKHMQLQVILKPPPENVQELYLESLAAIGIDLRQHDIKFEEDNWEAPTLSAWGVGWQVMLDGLEITQFTYFQQCGGVDLFPISAELTYGLERIGAFLQDVDSIYDIVWARDPDTGSVVKYGDVRLADELQFSVYNFEMADVEKSWEHFRLYEAECKMLLQNIDANLASLNAHGGAVSESAAVAVGDETAMARVLRRPILAAYDLCLKCSHLFNILDARGAISVTERVGVIARVRALAVGIAKAWVDQQKSEAAAAEKSDEPEPVAKQSSEGLVPAAI